MLNFPFDLPYWSLLNYIPNKKYDQAQKSREVIAKVKSGNEKIIKQIISLIDERPIAEALKHFLTPRALLVPIPRSSLMMTGSVWPSKIIAEEMIKQGYGQQVKYMLERRIAVRKSSQQSSEDRPSIKEHIDSLHICAPAELTDPETIILVDDVVTKGSIAIACFECLRNIYPDHRFMLFTIAKTQGFGGTGELDALAPHTGIIRYYESGNCYRDPS